MTRVWTDQMLDPPKQYRLCKCGRRANGWGPTCDKHAQGDLFREEKKDGQYEAKEPEEGDPQRGGR